MGAQGADHVGLCLLRGGQYDDSINAATRYVTLHPGSQDAAYAQYLIGSAISTKFPTSPAISSAPNARSRARRGGAQVSEHEYAVSAKKKIEVARDQLAGKEMMIGRYYMQSRTSPARINRFKVVVTQYQTTRHVEEALMRLTEAYMSLGIVSEAQTAAPCSGNNFPDSRWYKDAYNS
jgi:outer membrane protein assembly factor BamD